jgi:uncharacterized protein (TIGR03067 family)
VSARRKALSRRPYAATLDYQQEDIMFAHASWILGAGLLLLAGGAGQDAVKKELAKMQGTWKVVCVVINGQELKEDDIKDDRLIIKDDRFMLKGGKQQLEGKLTLDPGKTPKELDAEATGSDKKVTKSVGIYQLTGDTLKVCYSVPPNERPTEFTSEPKSARALVVYKKVDK